ncbi:hypothetical protein [Streptococcus uberis]|uniref:hypothetical protein n=1 Tax=Streptococcus uberis TaxID=1349 RepID=UPI003EFA12A8
MNNLIKLYDVVFDKKTNKKCIVVYISEELIDDCYLIEPIDNSFDIDWREESDLERICRY